MPTVTTRVSSPMLQEIDTFSRQSHTDRSTFLRNLLSKGLEFQKQEQVLQLYQQRKITLQKMASLLNITYLDALELLRQKELHLDYGLEELQEDLRGLQ